MKIELDALATLDAIAQHGSFAKAAEALHRVPSAVTYTVRKLEEGLGVALFDRSGHRAVLTAEGRLLLEQGRDLLQRAQALEARVRRSAQGWEAQLIIAVDQILPLERLFPLVARFDALGTGTTLRFTQETFGGTWDALIDRRADLAVGAPGEPPPGFGLITQRLQDLPFVFAVAPDHPLAALPEPLSAEALRAHRAVVVADSSRKLPPRSGGVQSGQPQLVVPSLAAKLAAQIAGLGAGFLPEPLARPALGAGQLVAREVEGARPPAQLQVAWRAGEAGRALVWFREALREARLFEP